jgi:hypothetical protein
MTIVIPYKDDILSGVELKFALRSIDQHLTGFTNLVIIGTPPDWYKGEYINAPNHNSRKQYSIYTKLLTACEFGAVSEDFIMWNDDHFLLKDIMTLQIMDWHDGYLKDTLSRNHGVRYKEAIANTLQILPDGLNYDIHTPCIYNKTAFKNLFEKKTDEICIKSCYLNRYAKFSCNMTDHKINQLLSKEAIKELIKDRLFFSTSTNGMKKPMIELLNELYPKPSQWER